MISINRILVIISLLLVFIPSESYADMDSELLESVKKGDVQKVKTLITSGADVNAVGGNKMTALMNACFYGHLEIVKVLLENGADIRAENENGLTALSAATYRKHEKIVKFLQSVLQGKQHRKVNKDDIAVQQAVAACSNLGSATGEVSESGGGKTLLVKFSCMWPLVESLTKSYLIMLAPYALMGDGITHLALEVSSNLGVEEGKLKLSDYVLFYDSQISKKELEKRMVVIKKDPK